MGAGGEKRGKEWREKKRRVGDPEEEGAGLEARAQHAEESLAGAFATANPRSGLYAQSNAVRVRLESAGKPDVQPLSAMLWGKNRNHSLDSNPGLLYIISLSSGSLYTQTFY